jgi:hypothetical protein
MNVDRDDERYDDILKKIAEGRPFGSKRRELQLQTPQDRALDRINAFDALAQLTRRDYRRVRCYGPKSLRGSAWSAAVVWYHETGYHGYQTLYLLGVWAHYNQDRLLLSIAERQLPYRAPVYDAGVYRVAIQNSFNLYYDDAGEPPDATDNLLHHCRYQENERLAQRQTLKDIVSQWQLKLETS